MRASRFSDAQKAFILKQADDGMPVAEICRKGRKEPGKLLQPRKRCGELLPTEMRRLERLEGGKLIAPSLGDASGVSRRKH